MRSGNSMRDTKSKSFTEAAVNMAVGYFIGFGLNIFVLPLIPGVHLPSDPTLLFTTAFYISIVYTAISLIRTYLFRRLFNLLSYNWSLWRTMKKIKKEMEGEFK